MQSSAHITPRDGIMCVQQPSLPCSMKQIVNVNCNKPAMTRLRQIPLAGHRRLSNAQLSEGMYQHLLACMLGAHQLLDKMKLIISAA